MCLRFVFLLITRVAAGLRLSRREEMESVRWLALAGRRDGGVLLYAELSRSLTLLRNTCGNHRAHFPRHFRTSPGIVGNSFVIGSPARAPKLKALAADPHVALTIDEHAGWPYSVLLVRGTAEVEMLDDVVPEYALSAERYFGPEQGPAWVSTLRGKPMARIPITPAWVGILDFKTRFPSALTV